MEGRKHGHHATLWQDTALLTATLRKHCDILKTSGYKGDTVTAPLVRRKISAPSGVQTYASQP
ncbi:hypothetical protein E2C01_036165 [Portunus trituberculatus]|uniref:Uncharacterized protein n=1 Tax=Portunus trituberculatus TaxID=210409 RepID=A0A5B7F7Z6_PORTR|nr:hypothetical protein [Portunus trituberculatus]